MGKTLFLVVIIILLFWILARSLIINNYHGPLFSDSMSKSISQGYFIKVYNANSKWYKINNIYYKSPLLWIEQGYFSKPNYILFSKIVLDNTYNLIIQDSSICKNNSIIFDLKVDGSILNCIEGLGRVYKLNTFNNKITIIVLSPDSIFGWNKAHTVDSIEYNLAN